MMFAYPLQGISYFTVLALAIADGLHFSYFVHLSSHRLLYYATDSNH